MAALLSCALVPVRAADARITKLVVTTRAPTFGGTTFGPVGAYEKIIGRAFGEVDPNDPRNATIADLALAPRNGAGMVEYSMDVYLLKPIDLAHGSRKLFYEASNRGLKLATGVINTVDKLLLSGDPTTAADAGDAFLMRRGFVIAWSGWDVTVPSNPGALAITVPVATEAGSPIVGPSLEEFVVDAPAATGRLSYPAATLDTSAASLTVRTHATDAPVAFPSNGWEYVDAQTIRLLPAGTMLEQGRLYDLVYPATSPLVAGLAFAATRDWVAFLRHAVADDVGTPNPVAGGIDWVYGFGLSQPARFLRDFVHLGFNEDDAGGGVVFDGLLSYLGGPGGGSFDHRFAQPGRTIRQHRDRLYPEIRFPFSWAVATDPVTGLTDGRLRRCLASGTCPKIFDVNSANEYWNKSASLLHTDASGNDLDEPPNVRFYLLSSLPHINLPGKGICQQEQNTLAPNPALRALLVALDAWAADGKKPPPSRVPRSGKGTLVASLPQSKQGFPAIPGVTYNGLARTGDLFDYGPTLDQGILTVLPPTLLGTPYTVLVPKTDHDGNDVAGIRLPAVVAPIATYTGWGLRAATFAGDDLCDASGQQIAFARTKVERVAAGDPRRSLAERYRTHDRYVKRVTRAAKRLRHQRLLVDEDVTALSAAAAAASVP
jgi:hypothetical protein